MNHTKLEFIATVSTIIGVWLISEEYYIYGWAVNGLADLLWVWWGRLKEAYYLVTLQLVLFLIALNGFHNAL